MLTKENVMEVFEEFSAKTKLDGVTLEIHDYEHPFIASYEAIQNILHIDVTLINNTDFNFVYDGLEKFNFSLEDYLKVILAHEFGHAKDRKNILASVSKETQWMMLLANAKNEKTRRQLISKLTSLYLTLETNGWENGKIYIVKKLMPFYMEIYRQRLDESVQAKRIELEHYKNQ